MKKIEEMKIVLDALIEGTTQMMVRRGITELKNDIAEGRVPRYGINEFGDLHDHVDANYYGGSFEFDLVDGMLEHVHPLFNELKDLEQDIVNEVQERMNRYIVTMSELGLEL